MTKPLLALALLTLFPAFAPAQASSADAARSDEIMKKVGQLDVLIQIVPLALTKEQITPLLTAIERAHQKQKEVFAQEAKDLVKIDPKVSKTVDDGIAKGVYPPRATQTEVAAFMRAMGLRRALLYNDMVDIVYAACKTTLNEGQLKAMEMSLKPEALDPSQKAAEMDATAKVKFFVRKVMLDPLAYDVLVQMAKRPDVPAAAPTP